jgi:DNA polymerase
MDINIDLETFSRSNIRDSGTIRYATDPTTEILMAAISVDGDPCIVWLPPSMRPIFGRAEWDRADEVLEYLKHDIQPDDVVRAFNAQFEKFCLSAQMEIRIPSENWVDTQITARRAGFPNDLATVASMCIGESKDKEGTRLIRKFSIPISTGKRKGERRYGWEDPADYDKFIDYCIQDVVVEQRVSQKAKPFEAKSCFRVGAIFTDRMNEKGIPVDVATANHAIKLREEAETTVEAEFYDTVGCKPSQRAQCVDWFNSQGYQYSSLDEEHVTRALDVDKSMTEIGQKMMRLRYNIAGSAVKKLDKMLAMVMPDDTVKGVFSFGGAQQTGRWSSQGLQAQNLKKPSQGMDTAAFYEMLKNRASLEEITAVYPDYHHYLGCSIRHFLTGPYCLCDYAAIEARVIAWLAGQNDLLQHFRDGRDVYQIMAGKVFRVDPDGIGKPSPERDLGKALVLGAGFGLGGQGFYNQSADVIVGGETEEDKVEIASGYIQIWREENPDIVEYWRECENAAMNAIRNPGKKYKARMLTYYYGNLKGRAYLICKLPSGRCLNYLDAKIKLATTPWDEKREQIHYYGKSSTHRAYQWHKMYGGKFVQHATQATAADVMVNGFNSLCHTGYDVRMLIHDESCILLDDDQMNDPNIGDVIEATMCEPASWMAGLPIEAESNLVPFYHK